MRLIYRYRLVLFFALLAATILGPLLKSGSILTLDSTIALNQAPLAYLAGLVSLPTSVFGATDNSAPLALLVQLMSNLAPEWVVEKVMLFLVLLLMGVGASRLPFLKGAARYYAGAFYVLNPFVYVRLLAGQWGLLLGYALTPFAVRAFFDLTEEQTLKNALRVVLLATLIGLAQVHFLGLLALIFVVMLVVKVLQAGAGWRHAVPAKGLLLALAMFGAINLYWLVPTAVDLAAGPTVWGRFAPVDMDLYRPHRTSSLGVMFDVASLHGFWRMGYKYTQDFFSPWWLVFGVMLFLAIFGGISHLVRGRSWRLPAVLGIATLGAFILARAVDSPPAGVIFGLALLAFLGAAVAYRGAPEAPPLLLPLAALAVLAYILGLGAATAPTRFIFENLWSGIPGFSVFRDSHKFLAILALAYAYLGALGLQELLRLYGGNGLLPRWHWRNLLLAGAVLLPLVYTFPIFGLAGQVKTTDYPREWYEIRDVLEADRGDYQVLFLPWHMYMAYGWLPSRDKTLANPAPRFFGPRTIAGDNIEFGLASQSVNPVSGYVEFLLDHSSSVDNFGELLAPLNVRYVILAHEADYEKYAFLKKQGDLRVAFEGKNVTLFENQYPHGRAYAAVDVVPLGSLEELLEFSRREDLLSHVLVLGQARNLKARASEEGGQQRILTTERVHLTRYHIQGGDRPYTVFVTAYGATSGHWRLDGRQPELLNLGMMPVFKNKDQGGALQEATVTFSRWPWLLGLEALALVVTTWACLYLVWQSDRLAAFRGRRSRS